MAKLFAKVETLIRRRILRRLIWVCTVYQLPFYGYPDYNGLKQVHGFGAFSSSIPFFSNIEKKADLLVLEFMLCFISDQRNPTKRRDQTVMPNKAVSIDPGDSLNTYHHQLLPRKKRKKLFRRALHRCVNSQFKLSYSPPIIWV